jgi:hypothetical protein
VPLALIGREPVAWPVAMIDGSSYHHVLCDDDGAPVSGSRPKSKVLGPVLRVLADPQLVGDTALHAGSPG